MADQDNVFGEDNSPKETDQNSGDPTPSSDNPFADRLSGIVNENGEQKYKSVEDALEALAHSQKFIKTLREEKQELENKFGTTQAELEKRRSVEDVVKELIGEQSKAPAEPGKTAPEQPGLDEDKVRQMLEGMLNQRTQAQVEQENFSKVQNALLENYGDKARDVIRSRAKELNTTPTELEKLAKQNPAMALHLLGGVQVQDNAPFKPTQTPPRNGPKDELPAPKKGLINGGAPTSDVRDEWSQIKASVFKKYGVEQ